MAGGNAAAEARAVTAVAVRCSAWLGASFDAMTPIARLSATVHDCNNEHVIGLDGIENGVWENVDETTPHILLE